MKLDDVDILKILPPNIADDRNVKMMGQAFNEALKDIIVKIPGIAIIPNLVRNEIIEHLLLDLLAWQFCCDFYTPDMPIQTKQQVIVRSLDWHTRKGTPSVVEEIASTVFSHTEIEEWYQYGGAPYHFRILAATDEELPDQDTFNALVRAINSVKNTRSYLEVIDAIKNGFAHVYVALVPCITKKMAVPSTENEAHAYVGITALLNGQILVPANENGAHLHFAAMPELNCSINILSGEETL